MLESSAHCVCTRLVENSFKKKHKHTHNCKFNRNGSKHFECKLRHYRLYRNWRDWSKLYRLEGSELYRKWNWIWNYIVIRIILLNIAFYYCWNLDLNTASPDFRLFLLLKWYWSDIHIFQRYTPLHSILSTHPYTINKILLNNRLGIYIIYEIICSKVWYKDTCQDIILLKYVRIASCCWRCICWLQCHNLFLLCDILGTSISPKNFGRYFWTSLQNMIL